MVFLCNAHITLWLCSFYKSTNDMNHEGDRKVTPRWSGTNRSKRETYHFDGSSCKKLLFLLRLHFIHVQLNYSNVKT